MLRMYLMQNWFNLSDAVVEDTIYDSYQWYHGMKIHSGTDAGSGYVHTITATSANVHDMTSLGVTMPCHRKTRN